MKKIFVFISVFIFILANTNSAFASKESDKFLKQYREAQMAKFELVQNLDPYQVEEYAKYAWAPYPLFRTSINLHFKSITIEPGYYILTPRTIKDKDFVFFKQAGKVVYIIPVIEKSPLTEIYYKDITPVPKRNMFGKIYYHTRTGFYNIFKKSKRQEPPKSHIEVSTIDGIYIRVDLCYGFTRYTMFFKSVKDEQ